MRVRTYESFWLLKNGLLYTYPSLQERISTEVVVLGAGITGALISHALLQAGYKTLLLDKRDIGMGSTSATTSMLQYEIDVPLYKLSRLIGEEAAVQCYRAGQQSINQLELLVKSERIDCGFEKKQSLYLAHNQRAADWLHREFLIRHKHKLGVRWMNAAQIRKQYGLQGAGGILSKAGASMDAYKFTHELIRKNAAKGLQVYDQVEIDQIRHHNRGITIGLKNGKTVTAKKIVYCTGYEALEMIPETIAELFTTYAIISEENIAMKKALHNLLVWDTRDPYLYLRSTDDNRLLVGGADTPYKAADLLNATKERKSKKLIQQAAQMVPGVTFIEDFNWAGVFGSTKDGLPYIGAHPDFKHGFFVLGFGGNGITFSVQGMQIITDWLAGVENPLAHFYQFGR